MTSDVCNKISDVCFVLQMMKGKDVPSLCTNKLGMRVKVVFNERNGIRFRGGAEDHRRMSSTEIESLEPTIPNTDMMYCYGSENGLPVRSKFWRIWNEKLPHQPEKSIVISYFLLCLSFRTFCERRIEGMEEKLQEDIRWRR